MKNMRLTKNGKSWFVIYKRQIRFKLITAKIEFPGLNLNMSCPSSWSFGSLVQKILNSLFGFFGDMFFFATTMMALILYIQQNKIVFKTGYDTFPQVPMNMNPSNWPSCFGHTFMIKSTCWLTHGRVTLRIVDSSPRSDTRQNWKLPSDFNLVYFSPSSEQITYIVLFATDRTYIVLFATWMEKHIDHRHQPKIMTLLEWFSPVTTIYGQLLVTVSPVRGP